MAETKQVLLVDDNPADVDLTSDVLSRNSCPSCVQAVFDGLSAMEVLKRRGIYKHSIRPDLLLLDLNLPGKDGRTVLEEVKADPELRSIPIVIFSTSRALADVQRCYELGANCYVNKPGNLQDFNSTVGAIANFWFCHSLSPGRES